MIHDSLCPVITGCICDTPDELCCQCHFIRKIRGDERMSCIEDVEGAYIVGTDGKILDTSHPEYSHDGTDNWNTAISVAVSYLKGLD